MTDSSDEVVDLTVPHTPDRADIVLWLRSSGGTLGERMMKHAAADLLEQDAEAVAEASNV